MRSECAINRRRSVYTAALGLRSMGYFHNRKYTPFCDLYISKSNTMEIVLTGEPPRVFSILVPAHVTAAHVRVCSSAYTVGCVRGRTCVFRVKYNGSLSISVKLYRETTLGSREVADIAITRACSRNV